MKQKLTAGEKVLKALMWAGAIYWVIALAAMILVTFFGFGGPGPLLEDEFSNLP